MARIYLESGALVKLYVVEPGSEQVQAAVKGADALLLTSLQLTELRNALLAAAGRGLLTDQALLTTLQHLDEDIQEGFFERTAPDWEQVWRQAEALSVAHTRELLCRTLDVLHVAVALGEKPDAFVTGDRRQAALAARAGLPVVEIQV